MDRNTILCYSCSEPALTVPKVIDGAQGQCKSCGLRGVVTVSDPDDGEGGCGLVAEFVTIEERDKIAPAPIITIPNWPDTKATIWFDDGVPDTNPLFHIEPMWTLTVYRRDEVVDGLEFCPGDWT